MTPIVPFHFDPTANDFEEHHLQYEDTKDGKIVTWPLVGASLFVSMKISDSFETLMANNQGRFRHFGFSGFSIGDYSEFLVSMPNEKFVGFKMGGIEATFGEATPLAALVFWSYHREKLFGPWDSIMSLRILGVGAGDVEIAFINACAAYEAKFGVLPDLFPINDSLTIEFDFDAEYYEQVFTIPPMLTNVEPLKFFYNGLVQVDDIAACIYFYRVLEYFSFFTNAGEMRRLRHDGSISDADFSKKILELVTKDEKGPIFKLIASLADDRLLAAAVVDGLIESPVNHVLAAEVYGLRNSIVHGKFSYGYSLQAGSVLDKDLVMPRWRGLLHKLARRALDQYGSKKT